MKLWAQNVKTLEFGPIVEIKIGFHVKVETLKPSDSCIRCHKKDCYYHYWHRSDVRIFQEIDYV